MAQGCVMAQDSGRLRQAGIGYGIDMLKISALPARRRV
jgi:hypothetical protein